MPRVNVEDDYDVDGITFTEEEVNHAALECGLLTDQIKDVLHAIFSDAEFVE